MMQSAMKAALNVGKATSAMSFGLHLSYVAGASSRPAHCVSWKPGIARAGLTGTGAPGTNQGAFMKQNRGQL